MAGIVTETKRRLLIGKEIKEVQVPTGTLDTSLYLADLASVGATFNSGRIASELGALPAVVKQNASLALIADSYKTGAVYAINGDTKSLEELNFERGSSATYEDASGNIVLASANVPRINYRNGVLQGWLVEPASTNLLLDSGVANGLDSFPIKSPGNEGLTAGASGFGIGSLLSNGVTLSKGSNVVYAYKNPGVSLVVGNTYTFSVFVKLSDGSEPTNNDMRIVFGGVQSLSWNNELIGSGIYRCYFTSIWPGGSGVGAISFGLLKNPSGSNKTVTVSGFQLEEGGLTSYIPTTTSVVTRLADKVLSKRPMVVFDKNSLFVKTAEYPSVWFGNGVSDLNIQGANLLVNSHYYTGSSAGIGTWIISAYASSTIVGDVNNIKVLSTLDAARLERVVSMKKGRYTLVINAKTPVPFRFNSFLNANVVNASSVASPSSFSNHHVVFDVIEDGPVTIRAYYGGAGISVDDIIEVDFFTLVSGGTPMLEWIPAPEDYIKIDSNGFLEISHYIPIHIQQLALISRAMTEEEVG